MVRFSEEYKRYLRKEKLYSEREIVQYEKDMTALEEPEQKATALDKPDDSDAQREKPIQ